MYNPKENDRGGGGKNAKHNNDLNSSASNLDEPPTMGRSKVNNRGEKVERLDLTNKSRPVNNNDHRDLDYSSNDDSSRERHASKKRPHGQKNSFGDIKKVGKYRGKDETSQ